MKEGLNTQFCREMPAEYEFETVYGKKIKMEGILRDAIELDNYMHPIFWIWTPLIPEDWLAWFQGKYIKQIRRTPVVCHSNTLSLYKPQVIIYHPQFEIKRVGPDVMEIKIVEGSLWKNH